MSVYFYGATLNPAIGAFCCVDWEYFAIAVTTAGADAADKAVKNVPVSTAIISVNKNLNFL